MRKIDFKYKTPSNSSTDELKRYDESDNCVAIVFIVYKSNVDELIIVYSPAALWGRPLPMGWVY